MRHQRIWLVLPFLWMMGCAMTNLTEVLHSEEELFHHYQLAPNAENQGGPLYELSRVCSHDINRKRDTDIALNWLTLLTGLISGVALGSVPLLASTIEDDDSRQGWVLGLGITGILSVSMSAGLVAARQMTGEESDYAQRVFSYSHAQKLALMDKHHGNTENMEGVIDALTTCTRNPMRTVDATAFREQVVAATRRASDTTVTTGAPPLLVLGPTQWVVGGTYTARTSGGSSSAELTWSLTEQPDGASLSLENPNTSEVAFIPEVAGRYTLEVEASMDRLATTTLSMQILVLALPRITAPSAPVLQGSEGTWTLEGSLPTGFVVRWTITDDAGATVASQGLQLRHVFSKKGSHSIGAQLFYEGRRVMKLKPQKVEVP